MSARFMKRAIAYAAFTICVLAACGENNAGNAGSSGNAAAVAANQVRTGAKTTSAADSAYATIVEQLYVAYFGRPADSNGLTNFEAALAAADAPADIASLSNAYSTNTAVKALVDSFGNSAESVALYGSGTPTQFVTAIYQNVLGRAPDQSGLNFWVGAISSGALSEGDAALSIMAGGLTNTTPQGLLDTQLINNRIAVATGFTAAMTTSGEIESYSGQAAAATARKMLGTITATTDISNPNPMIDTALDAIIDLANPSTDVTVLGTQLMRNGVVWIPHGFFQIAFVVPPAELQYQKAFYTVAAQNYSPQEYIDMRNAGADSVRIQVSQPGTDPQNALYSQEFSQNVIDAVMAARVAGLIAIISLQNEAPAGGITPPGLPSDAAQRVWSILAPIFASDRGVLFELFNEPSTTLPAPENWQAWATAMNTTISTVRNTGAVNVVVADGLAYAEELEGAPALTDPLGQVAYASHPYPHQASDQTSAAWDSEFGTFSQTAPVIITEWNNGYYCDANTATSDVEFIQYLQAHSVGLEVVAWDWSSAGFTSARYDFPNGQFSSFVGSDGALDCATPGYGPGKTVEVWYQTGIPASVMQ